jgi:hypothetical protein
MAFPINPAIDDEYVDPSGQTYVYDGRGWKVSIGAAVVNTLSLNNTAEYIPTEDYHPATKKYVDDNGGGAGVNLSGGRADSVYTAEQIISGGNA